MPLIETAKSPQQLYKKFQKIFYGCNKNDDSFIMLIEG